MKTAEINALNKAHDIIEKAMAQGTLSYEGVILYSDTRDGIAKVVEFENSVAERQRNEAKHRRMGMASG